MHRLALIAAGHIRSVQRQQHIAIGDRDQINKLKIDI